MAEKLNPEAFAEFGDGDDRKGIQVVNEAMILAYILETEELPPQSARPFAKWLDLDWNDFGSDGDAPVTVKDVIDGALMTWRGQ